MGHTDAIRMRHATTDDIAMLDEWNTYPHVITATTDDPDATTAFDGIEWADELAICDEYGPDVWRILIAELGDRPIGVVEVIDPDREPTHYWGDIGPGLRALDIWIGPADALGQGHGTTMMSLVIDECFAHPDVYVIVIDPLASNVRAHRFYERLGFVLEGPRQFDEDSCLVYRLTREDWQARGTQTYGVS